MRPDARRVRRRRAARAGPGRAVRAGVRRRHRARQAYVALETGRVSRVDGSLCQTAAWILRVGMLDERDRPPNREPRGIVPTLQRSPTGFGVVGHLGPCVEVDGIDVGWNRPTAPLGTGELTW